MAMGGFDKIELNSAKRDQISKRPAERQRPFMAAKKKQKLKKPAKIVLIVLLILVVFVGIISIPAFAAYKSALKTYREAKLISAAVKKQDISAAADEISKTKVDLADTQKKFHALLVLKFIPIVNFYYNDADHMLNAASAGLNTGTIVVNSLLPYADVLGLKGQSSFVGGTASDRIKTAVMTMGKITPQIDTIATSLVDVKKEVDAIDPNHYPEFIFGKNIKSQLTTLRTLTDQGVSFIDQAKPLVKVLPDLLGASGSKKYLVIFQNDKELRPTGGFITAYAIFSIDSGAIHLDKTDDIYTLDASVPDKPKAPDAILKYFPGVYTFNLRDSNISPDYMQSMKTFRSMYESAGQYVPVDGIIAIDTSVLVSTIKILDNQVTVDGTTFTTDKDPHCDCPQVIYELENSISRPVNYIRTDRKGLLGDLLQAIMVKALSSSPKIYWNPLFQSFIMQINQKHVLFDLYDQGAQSGIEALNAAGQVHNTDGDYFYLNEANFSGAKVNIFLQEQIEQSYDVANDGTVTKTVTVHYKNPYPPSDCNLERGNLCLNALYRDWFRMYVPKGSQLVDSKGAQVKLTTYEDLGKTVFDGFITVRTQGVATLTVTYKLPFKLSGGSPLPVLIQKQPGTDGIPFTISVNGKETENFPLYADKQFTIKP
jgi:hypothetical protein